jgi:putative restriction endonuclease
MAESSLTGSKKAASYLRALDLLGPVLVTHIGPYSSIGSLWEIRSVAQLNELYAYILDQQRLGEAGIFAEHESPSYWRSGFYSAAIKSLKEFLVIHRHEQQLWEVYRSATKQPIELARNLEEQPLDDVAELIDDKDVDFSTREGRDILRSVKTRVNQSFFRTMVLDNYGTRCCLTGIPIPHVLRASHIIPWAEDESNRMNPANGLCLSATYDAAFDAHLISFDEDLHLILSPNLREFVDDEAFGRHFKALERVRLNEARRFMPDEGLMAEHRERLKA